MPLTPDEAAAKNRDNGRTPLDRAIRELVDEVELALEDYMGEHLYVGLPAYLQYRAEADKAVDAGPVTLRLVDRKLHERFGPFGWKIGIVTNSARSYSWVKLMDAREL